MEPSHKVVAIPFPGRGHINPMMVLCQQLIARRIHVIFVVTEEWRDLINSADPLPPPELDIMTIPNCIPSEHSRAKDHAGFIDAVYTRMAEPSENLLDRLESAPRAIIADTYLPWVVEIGNQRGIPVCSFNSTLAAFFSALLHFKKIPSPENRQLGDRVKNELLENYIPTLPSLKLSDVDPLFGLSTLKLALKAAETAEKAQCMLFTSFYELESYIIDSISEGLNYPVYAIGPLIPHMFLHNNVTGSSDYLAWLDNQPKKSVLYLSLGSFLSVSLAQLEEIAMGVNDSGVKFLWVVRENCSLVQSICGSNGLIVPWCNQLKVLMHSSVGGFLTHCGLNSTLETVFSGVPILALPIFWDQIVDARLLTDECKIGLNLRDKMGTDGILSREVIKDAVKKLMDTSNAESNEMRRRASDWSRAATIAVKECGSSCSSLGDFISEFIDRSELNAARS